VTAFAVSTTLRSVDWHNSRLPGGDIAAKVAKLEDRPGNEPQVHGSGGLAQTLIEHDLVDEYRLLLFPVHLGSGKKLFRERDTRGTLSSPLATANPGETPQYSAHPRR